MRNTRQGKSHFTIQCARRSSCIWLKSKDWKAKLNKSNLNMKTKYTMKTIKFASNWLHPRILVRSVLLNILIFCVVLCFCALFVCVLRLVCPMLPASLDCSFAIAPSILSKVYVNTGPRVNYSYEFVQNSISLSLSLSIKAV